MLLHRHIDEEKEFPASRPGPISIFLVVVLFAGVLTANYFHLLMPR